MRTQQTEAKSEQRIAHTQFKHRKHLDRMFLFQMRNVITTPSCYLIGRLCIQFNQSLLNNIYIVIIIHGAQFIKQIITGIDSNISDKCNIQKYHLELRRKLKAYTMSRFYLKFGLQSVIAVMNEQKIMVALYVVMNEILYEIRISIYSFTCAQILYK